jgi:hypothetical protein
VAAAGAAGVPVTGFQSYPTPVLEGVRANLLRGLDLVAAHLDAGTFETIPAGRACPPCQSGHLTLILLGGVDAELARRNGDTA